MKHKKTILFRMNLRCNLKTLYFIIRLKTL